MKISEEELDRDVIGTRTRKPIHESLLDVIEEVETGEELKSICRIIQLTEINGNNKEIRKTLMNKASEVEFPDPQLMTLVAHAATSLDIQRKLT